ncbi:MAG TPA: LiaF domain-containing protein, partial [Pseudonocardiaceae bacterium]
AAPSSSVLLAVFGDVKRRGRWSLRPRTWVWTLFGDVRLDLGSALISDREVEINAVLLFGDLKVTVPAGVEVEVNGLALFGDRELDLAAVPRAPGTPRIRVRAFALFGDVKVRSRS